MKVRLLANDSKIPNLAIMKISSYHKSLGDDVNWYDPMFDMYDTDIFYESKIFTFSPDFNYYPVGAKIFRGGTGVDVKSQHYGGLSATKIRDAIIKNDMDYVCKYCPTAVVKRMDIIRPYYIEVSQNPKPDFAME